MSEKMFIVEFTSWPLKPLDISQGIGRCSTTELCIEPSFSVTQTYLTQTDLTDFEVTILLPQNSKPVPPRHSYHPPASEFQAHAPKAQLTWLFWMLVLGFLLPWKGGSIVLSLFPQEGRDDSLCSLGESNVVRTEEQKSLGLTPV